jgi:galactose mutarotase-like enzyme
MEEAVAVELETVKVKDESGTEQTTIRAFSLSLRSTTIHLCSLGASLLQFLVNDEVNHETVDIVCGYKDAKSMHASDNPCYFHAIVGRVANRIAMGKFAMGDQVYRVPINNPPNSLHGGIVGLSRKVWDAEIIRGGTALQFSLISPDGDQGYPGTVQLTAIYTLRPSFSKSGVFLQLDLHAKLLNGSKSTPINLSSHSYFNLGDSKEGILDHSLTLNAEAYTPVDANLIPTRKVQSLDKDPTMDFRNERILRKALEDYGVRKIGLSAEQSRTNVCNRATPLSTSPYGFDHNYVVRHQPGMSLPKVGTLSYSAKRRHLTVYSDAPGVQCYTANYLGGNENDSVCKANYKRWDAVCLETQHFPDSISTAESAADLSSFWAGKCPILTPAEPQYRQTVVYRLETDYPNAWKAYRGSDTQGLKYDSIETMWQDQDLSTWYQRAKGWYEDNCDTTIDGVLGGIGHISDKDLQGSRIFLKDLTIPPSAETGSKLACECGAGIGRVTKGLLLDFVDRCDLVESSPRLLYSAPNHLGNLSNNCRFFCSELQDWKPGVNRYSIIWVQWVLCYLTDKDIVEFLRRCSDSLVDGGWIVLKENTSPDEAFIVDIEDASVTRSLEYWLDLIAKSGLRVRQVKWQDDFPDEIYPVPFILVSKGGA